MKGDKVKMKTASPASNYKLADQVGHLTKMRFRGMSEVNVRGEKYFEEKR